MAGLSNIFGGDNQSSNADGDLGTDTAADAGNAVDLDVNSSQSQESTDEDGDSSATSNENNLSFGSDTDSLLGNATDAFGSAEQDSN